jgi:hypothetical protein
MSLRSALKKIPGLHTAYRSTPFYKAKQQRLSEEQRVRTEIREKIHERLFRLAFHNDLTVRFGPFAGMRYVAAASGSQVLPKVLGSYEEPIQPWIEEIISGRKYDLIIDVGCAEGYYAVGFARRMPNVRIHAFDVDPRARERTGELAELNQVSDRVLVGAECTFDIFQTFGCSSTLVFCDIEGAEDFLLDPVKAPRLKECGIFVEAHDLFVAGVSDRLIARFGSSHRIRMVVDYPGRLADYELPGFDLLSSDDRAMLTDEIRSDQMRFFFLEPLPSLAG